MSVTFRYLNPSGQDCDICYEEKHDGFIGHQDNPNSAKHIYHRQCIAPWLEQHRTCPTCRREVTNAIEFLPLSWKLISYTAIKTLKKAILPCFICGMIRELVAPYDQIHPYFQYLSNYISSFLVFYVSREEDNLCCFITTLGIGIGSYVGNISSIKTIGELGLTILGVFGGGLIIPTISNLLKLETKEETKKQVIGITAGIASFGITASIVKISRIATAPLFS